MSVVIVGSLNADLLVSVDRLPHPGETVRGSDLSVRPGGKGANQAAAAARLGARVSLVGAVGDDEHGRLLVGAAGDAGVRTERVRRLDSPTGTAMITVDSTGENTIVISPGANARLAPDDARAGIGPDTAVVGLCLEIPPATVAAAVARAQEVGASVVLNLSPYADLEPAVLAAVDVLLVNEIELEQLVGPCHEPADALERLADLGVDRAVVTLGAAGATVLDATVRSGTRVPSPEVEVVDTTGCGDAFTGAVISRLAAGADLLGAVETGVRAGAFAATGAGAQPSYPTAEQLGSWPPTG